MIYCYVLIKISLWNVVQAASPLNIRYCGVHYSHYKMYSTYKYYYLDEWFYSVFTDKFWLNFRNIKSDKYDIIGPPSQIDCTANVPYYKNNTSPVRHIPISLLIEFHSLFHIVCSIIYLYSLN